MHGATQVSYLNATIDPDADTFQIFNREQLFRTIWRWYLDGKTVDEIMAPVFEEMLARRHAEKPMTDTEVAELREYVYVGPYVRDYRPRFEESRRHFLMIDRFPGNNARFNLALKQVGDRLEIAEA